MAYVLQKVYQHCSDMWDLRGKYFPCITLSLKSKYKPDEILNRMIETFSAKIHEFYFNQLNGESISNPLCIHLDGRLDDYPFMSSPLSMIILISTYLFVIRNGKKFMEHRKPYDIEKLIIGYNILQIIINSVLFILVSSITCCNCVVYWVSPPPSFYAGRYRIFL